MILVTGATGFVGAEIVRRASRRGWRVRGLARHPEEAEALGRLPHVELFRGDVLDPPTLAEAMEGVEQVIHLVGIIAPTRRQSFEDVHVGGTRNAVAASLNAGVRRFVHMSALGADRGRERSEYWRTKWAAEEEVRAAAGRAGGLEATIFRPSLVFGPDDEFFNRLARIARWSPVVPLPAGGRQEFQPVWVGDVAEAFLQAARMERTPRPLYEAAGPEVLTLREIVKQLAAVLGKRRAVAPLPVAPLRLIAAAAERALPSPPVTRDQLAMLEVPNVADPDSVRAFANDFEIEHATLARKAPEWLARTS
jgi:NADH dehydrogenase